MNMEKIVHDKWEKHWEKTFLEYPDESVVRYIMRENVRNAGTGKKRILDFGCGTGRHTIVMAKKGYTVTAADFTETCLEKVKEWAAKEGLDVNIVHNEPLSIPLPDKSFDITVAFGTLFYSTKEKNIQLLRELNRVTELGGEFFTDCRTHDDFGYTSAKDGLTNGTYEPIHKDCFLVKADELVRFYPTIEDIHDSFNQAGFDVYEIEKKEFTRNNRTTLYSWWQIYARKVKDSIN